MSLYKCKLIPIDRLLVGPTGVITPLCNDCQTKDCSNPIEPVSFTVFGKKVSWRIYKKYASASIVVQCAGHSRDG